MRAFLPLALAALISTGCTAAPAAAPPPPPPAATPIVTTTKPTSDPACARPELGKLFDGLEAATKAGAFDKGGSGLDQEQASTWYISLGVVGQDADLQVYKAVTELEKSLHDFLGADPDSPLAGTRALLVQITAKIGRAHV